MATERVTAKARAAQWFPCLYAPFNDSGAVCPETAAHCDNCALHSRVSFAILEAEKELREELEDTEAAARAEARQVNELTAEIDQMDADHAELVLRYGDLEARAQKAESELAEAQRVIGVLREHDDCPAAHELSDLRSALFNALGFEAGWTVVTPKINAELAWLRKVAAQARHVAEVIPYCAELRNALAEEPT